MAFAVEPVEPKRRPAVVTVACWLLYLAAAGQVISAIATFSQLGATRRAYEKVFTGASMQGAAATFVAIMAASAVVSLAFAAGYVVLGILNGRGKNPARIVTWVLAGIAICLSGCGLVSTAIGAAGISNGNSTNGAPRPEEIKRALSDTVPGWYQPLVTTVGVIALAALVVTVVLLALPIANDFFRKRPEAEWTSPVPPPTA